MKRISLPEATAKETKSPIRGGKSSDRTDAIEIRTRI